MRIKTCFTTLYSHERARVFSYSCKLRTLPSYHVRLRAAGSFAGSSKISSQKTRVSAHCSFVLLQGKELKVPQTLTLIQHVSPSLTLRNQTFDHLYGDIHHHSTSQCKISVQSTKLAILSSDNPRRLSFSMASENAFAQDAVSIVRPVHRVVSLGLALTSTVPKLSVRFTHSSARNRQIDIRSETRGCRRRIAMLRALLPQPPFPSPPLVLALL